MNQIANIKTSSLSKCTFILLIRISIAALVHPDCFLYSGFRAFKAINILLLRGRFCCRFLASVVYAFLKVELKWRWSCGSGWLGCWFWGGWFGWNYNVCLVCIVLGIGHGLEFHFLWVCEDCLKPILRVLQVFVTEIAYSIIVVILWHIVFKFNPIGIRIVQPYILPYNHCDLMVYFCYCCMTKKDEIKGNAVRVGWRSDKMGVTRTEWEREGSESEGSTQNKPIVFHKKK